MEIYYQGENITPFVNVTKCVHRDVSHGRADTLEIEFDRAADWYRWAADMEIDDEITVTRDGYTTGPLYLNTVLPEGNRFRLLATSLKSTANRRTWDTYRNMTLDNIMHRCAMECGMSHRLFGIDGNTLYPFLMRQNEGCAAFLNRLASWEGMNLKTINRALTGIAIPYAQDMEPRQRLYIDANQDGVKHMLRENAKYSALTIRTPYAEATARDSAAGSGYQIVIAELPAMNAAQAGRWARGMLLHHNRKAETLTVQSTFNPSVSAMIRADVEGTTAANGEWLVEEAEHDLYNGSTIARYVRVIDTIQ